jgi:hemerythrin
MPLLLWSEGLSVGVRQFDQDHRVVVDLINELFDAVQAGRGRETLGETLNRLFDYTKTHIIKEERVLEQHGYPELASHRQDHKAISSWIGAIRQRYDAGATNEMCMEVLTFMRTWLFEHIQGTDKKYQAFLNARGLH